MNKLLILIALTFTTQIQAEDNFCPATSDLGSLDILAQDGCEATDKLVSCAEKPVDEDRMARRFDHLFDNADKEKEKIQKYYDSAYKNSPVLEAFYTDPSLERYAKEHHKPYPEPLLDWFTDNDSIEGTNKEAFKSKMKEKYVAFAKNNDCTPVVKSRYTFLAYPDRSEKKTLKEIQDVMRAPDFEQNKDAFFDEYNAKALNNGSFCDKKRMTGTGPYRHVSETFPPCSGNVSGVFKDNAWSSSTLDEKLAGEATDEVVGCIKDRLAKGANIHHISIVASASALNNTGEAATRFCKKGFLALSEARAKAAQENILPKLFSKAGANAADFNDKIQMNFQGSNGDGTSGPCPYEIVNDKEVLKAKYRTAEGKRELDKNKYIKIHVTFDSKTKAVNSSESFYEPHYSCRNIYFQCSSKQ